MLLSTKLPTMAHMETTKLRSPAAQVFGERLSALQVALGLSNAEMASQLGISVSGFLKYKRGDGNGPPAAVIDRACRAFKKRPESFFDLSWLDRDRDRGAA